MLKKSFSNHCAALSCMLLIAVLFVQGGDSKRFRPAKSHPSREASSTNSKRPDDNGEFEVYYTTPGGKRIGCTGLFTIEGKEEISNIFIEDNRGSRQRIKLDTLRQSFLPNFGNLIENVRRYAFLPVICLLPALKPIAGFLGINLDVDLLNMDNILSFNVNASTGIEIEASASFACPRGPPGPPGRAGFPGLQGPAGPAGPDGYNGNNGFFGPKGPPGEIGLPGQMGPDGYPGSEGAIGTIGLPGPNGEDGRDGRDGEQGVPGSRGTTGTDGAYGGDGTNGADGPQGPPGNPGSQGAQGQPGLPGSPGLPGPNGIPGGVGLNGRPGIPGLNGIDGQSCPGSMVGGSSEYPQTPASDGCSFIEVNKKELLKGSVTIGGGGGGGGGDLYSGAGGQGGSAQGVGIADAGSTGLGFYICNSKNLTFTISIDNNSDTIAINDSKTAEEEYGEKFPMNFDEYTKSSKVKVDVNSEGDINIVPLGNADNLYSFTRHAAVRPRSGFPIF